MTQDPTTEDRTSADPTLGSVPPAASRRRPARVREVVVDDPFWNPYLQRMATITLPTQLEQMTAAGYLDALRLDWKPGDPHRPHIFWESDLAKWVEAASYRLAHGSDPGLQAQLDAVVALLRKAQQPDGYLNAYFTVVEPGRRFTDHQDAHELYCAGHLIEAAVAHHESTGSTDLLDLARGYADLLVERFGPGGADEGGYDGHPEIELALVRLHRATGDRRYLDLAARLVDNRGRQPFFFAEQTRRRGDDGFFAEVFPGRTEDPMRWAFYQQSHRPVRDQDEAVGHAVRAVYLYAGATDVALETDDPALWQAVGRLWRSVTEQKMYVTGGIGAIPRIEGFGAPYELPNAGAYAETCAAIGLANWATRLGNATGEGRFFDVVERALYNGILSGTALDGRHYFYANPLSSRGDYARSEWFGTSCCPPNLARLLGTLGTLVWARSADTLAVNLFVGSRLTTELAGAEVRIRQQTRYPADGRIELVVEQTPSDHRFRLALRVPGWAEDHALTVNDAPVELAPSAGYLVLDRAWRPGDRVRLELPLHPRRVHAHPAVRDDVGRVALARGPVVYCVEGVDHDVPTERLGLPVDAALAVTDADWSPLPLITATGVAAELGGPPFTDRVAAGRSVPLTAVPYAFWGNRGTDTMDVWVPERPAAGSGHPG